MPSEKPPIRVPFDVAEVARRMGVDVSRIHVEFKHRGSHIFVHGAIDDEALRPELERVVEQYMQELAVKYGGSDLEKVADLGVDQYHRIGDGGDS